MHAKSLQSWLSLCYPMDGSLPGSSVLGILQKENWTVLSCPLLGIFLIQGWTCVFYVSCIGRWVFFLSLVPLGKLSAASAKSLQSCLTRCNLIDGSPSGSSVPGILQARIPEWVAISLSNACMHAKLLR